MEKKLLEVFVKKVLSVEGDDKPKLRCNDDTIDKKLSKHAKSVWEETVNPKLYFLFSENIDLLPAYFTLFYHDAT